MELEYRIFYPTLGQESPPNSLRIGVPGGGILWRGEAGTLSGDYASEVKTFEELLTIFATASKVSKAEIIFSGLIPPRAWAMGWLADGNRIVGNGVDFVTMEIRAAEGDTTASVNVVVDGTTQAVIMTDGVGQLEISSNSPPGVIAIVGSGVLAGKTLSLHVAQGE